MAIPNSSLQKVDPSAIIELFKLELIEGTHYATGNPDSVTTVYRFHSGTSLKTNNAIVWAGDTYDRYPVECAGFELSGQGAIARPQMRISNILSLFTTLMATVNSFNFGNDLVGAKFTRIQTMVEFIDAVNFANNLNPFGTPDTSKELPKRIYVLNKKNLETREIVEYEMVAAIDLPNVELPTRIATKKIFPAIGDFI
tara:strand:- start:3856 stop:4449 length:594 start_codon:yes stop_codon:yes gene_type:complete